MIEVNGLEQGATQALDDGARNLVLQFFGIHYRAAIKCFDHANDLHVASLDDDFGAGGDVATFFESSGDANSVHWHTTSARAEAGPALVFVPPELIGSRLKHGAEPLIFEVLQAKFQRIHTDFVRQFVHVRLARKVISG